MSRENVEVVRRLYDAFVQWVNALRTGHASTVQRQDCRKREGAGTDCASLDQHKPKGDR
jgi:hypothetical protein